MMKILLLPLAAVIGVALSAPTVYDQIDDACADLKFSPCSVADSRSNCKISTYNDVSPYYPEKFCYIYYDDTYGKFEFVEAQFPNSDTNGCKKTCDERKDWALCSKSILLRDAKIWTVKYAKLVYYHSVCSLSLTWFNHKDSESAVLSFYGALEEGCSEDNLCQGMQQGDQGCDVFSIGTVCVITYNAKQGVFNYNYETLKGQSADQCLQNCDTINSENPRSKYCIPSTKKCRATMVTYHRKDDADPNVIVLQRAKRCSTTIICEKLTTNVLHGCSAERKKEGLRTYCKITFKSNLGKFKTRRVAKKKSKQRCSSACRKYGRVSRKYTAYCYKPKEVGTAGRRQCEFRVLTYEQRKSG